MKRRNSFLLQGSRRLSMGAVVSGFGFLLYILAAAMGWETAADVLVMIFGVVSAYVFASVAAERRRDRESVSYNLLWGQAALALLTCMCAVLTLREKLGH